MRGYSRIRAVSYFRQYRQGWDYAAEALALAAKFPKAVTVLEIGAGSGDLTKHLLACGMSVTALEPSVAMWGAFDRATMRNPACRLLLTPIEKYQFEKKFDLIVAHYDVLNYVSHRDIGAVLLQIARHGKHLSLQVWDSRQPVKLFRRRRFGDCRQIRLAYKWFGAVHVWFLHWGRGISLSKHKLYLHRLPAPD